MALLLAGYALMLGLTGAGMALVRDLAHIVDGFFYLGYLWPLWDATPADLRRQDLLHSGPRALSV